MFSNAAKVLLMPSGPSHVSRMVRPRDYSRTYSIKKVAIIFPGRGSELVLAPGHSIREMLSSPLGVGYISSSISASLGVEVRIIDLNIPGKDLKTELEKFSPDLVGVSILKAHTKMALEIAQIVSRYFPDAILVAGGAQPTISPAEFLGSYDFVVRGEGERSAVNLIKALERGGNAVASVEGLAFYDGNNLVSNPPRRIEDINFLPFPDMKFVEEYPDSVGGGNVLIASRGCPFGCIFCAKEVVGQSYRRRSNSNIIAEIERYVQKYGTTDFQFKDDIFSLNREQTKDFCRELIRRGIKITWGFATRADAVDEETLELMFRAGARRISLGVESGDDAMLKILNKREQATRNLEAVRMAKAAGFENVRAFLMVGLPGQDSRSIDMTLEFLGRAQPHSIVVHYFTPFPGTPAFERREALGIKFLSDPSDIDVWERFYHSGPLAEYPIVETREMTAQQIFEAKQRILAAFAQGKKT